MLFHILRHIYAQHGVFVIKQKLSQTLAQFGFADAGRPQKQERPNRLVRVGNSGTRAAYRIGDGFHRLILPDDAFFQIIFQMQQLFAFGRQHFVCRNACPFGNDFGYVFGLNRLLFGLFRTLLQLCQFRIQLRDNAVLKLSGAFVLSVALGNLRLASGFVQPVFDFGNVLQVLFLLPPLGVQRTRLLFQIGELFFYIRKTGFGIIVGFLFQCFLFYFQLQNLPVKRIQFFRLGIDSHTQRRRRFVHQVNRLIRHITVGNVTVGQRGGGNQRRVGNPHAVMQFKLFLNTAENGDCFLYIRLVNINRLETTRQGGVFFDILLIFVQRGGTDTVQFAPCQRRF